MAPPTTQATDEGVAVAAGPRAIAAPLRLLPALLLVFLCGCIGNPMTLFKPAKKPDDPPPAGEGMVLRGGKLEADTAPAAGSAAADLATAKEFHRTQQYDKAEKLFNKVASNEKNLPAMAEEARYFQAECQRLTARYPKACHTYIKCLKDFPSGGYHRDACQRIFDIANYWLDETRDMMEARTKGIKESPFSITYIHWEKTKPFLDMRGDALEALEQVYLNDPTGELGAKALFYIGSVRFFLEEYREADHYFNQLVTNFPNGPYASKSLELAIICKQLSTGGVDYDPRRLADARRLVHTALNAYPELRDKRGDFLERQLATINLQQAAHDFAVAEFYERVKRPGSAFFYYEVVRRRYPGTKYSEEAAKRMVVLEKRAEKLQAARKAVTFSVWPFGQKTQANAAQGNPAQGAPAQGTPADGQPSPTPGNPLQPQQPEALPQPRTLPNVPGPNSPEPLPQPRTLPNLPGSNALGGPQQ